MLGTLELYLDWWAGPQQKRLLAIRSERTGPHSQATENSPLFTVFSQTMVTATHSPCTLEDSEGRGSEQAPALSPYLDFHDHSRRGLQLDSLGGAQNTATGQAPPDPIMLIRREELVKSIHWPMCADV